MNHERTVHNGATSAEEKGKDANRANEIGVPESALETADETCRDKIGNPPLTTEGLRQWEMHAHVDHVYDLVPFWQRGMDAAEKGEVLRLEEFLDKMEGDGGWRTAHQVLGMLGVCDCKVSQSEQARDGWGQWAEPSEGGGGGWGPNPFGWGTGDGWGVEMTRVTSEATESSRGSELKMGRAGRSRADAVQDRCGTRILVEPVRAVQGNNELRNFVDVIARQEAVNEQRRKQLYLFFEVRPHLSDGPSSGKLIVADDYRTEDPKDTRDNTFPPHARLTYYITIPGGFKWITAIMITLRFEFRRALRLCDVIVPFHSTCSASMGI